MSRAARQFRHPAAAVSAGLAVSQFFFFLFVYRSNLLLLEKLAVVSDAGYLAVPNGEAVSGLSGWIPAFCGGLFFTFTAGAGLTLLAFLPVYIMRTFFPGRSLILLLPSAAWIFLVFRISATSRDPVLAAVFCAVPVLAGWAAAICSKPCKKQGSLKSVFMHLLVMSAVACAWLPCLGQDFFIKIRDGILLTNPAGEMINSFYYRYTLYPAEAFKSPEQKQIKTAFIHAEEKGSLDLLEKSLRRLDYLPVEKKGNAEIKAVKKGDALILENRDKEVLKTSFSRFSRSPGKIMDKFSAQSDSMRFLRQFTLFCLASASPVIVYLALYAVFSGALVFIPAAWSRKAAAAVLCLAVCSAPAIYLYTAGGCAEPPSGKAGLKKLLESENLHKRLTALREITDKGLDIKDLGIKAGMPAGSSFPAERYWTAKALGNSSSEDALRLVKKLLKDPHPNVVCAALDSLGKLGCRDDAARAKKVILSNDHWYIQHYAYNALRELGWSQPKSI